MADVTIEVTGLTELIRKFDQLPNEVQQSIMKTMVASLDTLRENVPPYIPQVVPPHVYRRTEQLGRSLGSSMQGGKVGNPTVYGIYSEMGGKSLVGQFGTNLSYAQYVVDPERQAYMHRPGYKGRPGWWTMKTIKEKALPKIERLWDAAIEAITRKFNL